MDGGGRHGDGRISPRPMNLEFYRGLRKRFADRRPCHATVLRELEGAAVDLRAGQAVSLTLMDAAQIVNVFAFNRDDCYERLWHTTMLSEGAYLTRYSRLWGTMPRCRPLLTVIEDTVGTPRDADCPGRHHPILGGGGTPADWYYRNGEDGVATTWEQFAAVLEERGIPLEILGEDVCLFQKSRLEPRAQRFQMCRSEASIGDSVALFAEIDVCLLLALSPFVDGARSPSEPGVPAPRPVKVEVFDQVAEPLGWPYPGVPYPNLSRYVGAAGESA